jgi:hypothetical protein
VRRAAALASLRQAVTATALRRSYIVQCLRDGANGRELQAAAGHQHLATTLDYRRYLPLPQPLSSVPPPSILHPPPSAGHSAFAPALACLQPGGP